MQSGKKITININEEDNMSEVRSCKTETQKFIQSQSLFTHVLSNIVGCLYSKASEEQIIMAEKDLKNAIILDSGSSN